MVRWVGGQDRRIGVGGCRDGCRRTKGWPWEDGGMGVGGRRDEHNTMERWVWEDGGMGMT